MKKRYLFDEIKALALKRNKMAFISGPRQVGKTTLAKSISPDFDETAYKNWDETEFRRLWVKSPNQVRQFFSLEAVNKSHFLILDEIHKSKSWKQKLKGIYDELGQDISILSGR